MTQTAMEGFEQFVFLTIGRQILDEAFHECVQLYARAAHPVEIGEHALGLRGARILDDHVEQIGDGSGRRLQSPFRGRRSWRVPLVRSPARCACSMASITDRPHVLRVRSRASRGLGPY